MDDNRFGALYVFDHLEAHGLSHLDLFMTASSTANQASSAVSLRLMDDTVMHGPPTPSGIEFPSDSSVT